MFDFSFKSVLLGLWLMLMADTYGSAGISSFCSVLFLYFISFCDSINMYIDVDYMDGSHRELRLTRVSKVFTNLCFMS